MADIIRSAALRVPHGFLTAAQSDAGHMHLAVGDMPVARVKQVHSAVALGLVRPFPDCDRPEADAMVIDNARCALAIVTADCAPVLFADEQAGVIAAAHAGWRGAQAGIIANTVRQMEAQGARRSRIVAAIGPCIAQANYEVGADMRDCFTKEDARFFTEGTNNKWQFDLAGYVASKLEQAEVGEIDALRIDTYAGESGFHSYRRATHRGGPTDGRQFSLIALPD
ncbi:peptidoglycan editing factor PgeF [Aurantiacibacter sp. D1-12]|uniref:peptidoglycan editing factor PgeF n=1 Tax=Aurantiacibacter sp. D1-12 TaxID=2993658 RepID=UPI00237C54DB|nr:peptidoglycan editing factor PgeF [Aurantiacibacter sp. D1-12]MDE1468043.1 peptidoglycan editing factor PgeF [Aurantiacibacter sp. D1-12]